MYKDPDKQREANRIAQARFKAKGITNQGITPTSPVIPEQPLLHKAVAPKKYALHIIPKPTPRRGKDITKFEHLPPDVQGTINRLSKDDDQEHGRRTAIAINYQHTHPERYYSTGV